MGHWILLSGLLVLVASAAQANAARTADEAPPCCADASLTCAQPTGDLGAAPALDAPPEAALAVTRAQTPRAVDSFVLLDGAVAGGVAHVIPRLLHYAPKTSPPTWLVTRTESNHNQEMTNGRRDIQPGLVRAA